MDNLTLFYVPLFDNVYQECKELSLLRGVPLTCCHVLTVVGCLGMFLTIPVVVCSLLSGILLVVGLNTFHRHNMRRKTFAIIFFLVDQMHCLVFGIVHLLLLMGLPWINKSGFNIETQSSWNCRGVGLFQSLVLSFTANLMVAETLSQIRNLQFEERVSQKRLLLLILLCFGFSLAFSLPELVLRGVWRLDGRLHCSTLPTHPKLIILWLEVQRFLFCDGFVPSILSLANMVYIQVKTRKLSSTISFLHSFVSQYAVPNNIQQLEYHLREIKQDARLVVWHAFPLSLLFGVLSIVRLLTNLELYLKTQNPDRVSSRLYLYCMFGIRDITYFCFIVSGVFHFWIHFSSLKCIRYWRRKRQRTEITLRPVSQTKHIVTERLRQVEEFIQQTDQKLYRILSTFPNNESHRNKIESSTPANGQTTSKRTPTQPIPISHQPNYAVQLQNLGSLY